MEHPVVQVVHSGWHVQSWMEQASNGWQEQVSVAQTLSQEQTASQLHAATGTQVQTG
jgi:hypothetical protein